MDGTNERQVFSFADQALERARKGDWSTVRASVVQAIGSIRDGNPQTPWALEFLSEVFAKLSDDPEYSQHALAVEALRESRKLSDSSKEGLLSFLESVRDAINGALDQAALKVQSIEKHSPSKLLKPSSPAHRLLNLPSQVTKAFGLGPRNQAGGRPTRLRSPLTLFDEFEILLGYGASKAEGQEILANRFDCTPRTIQSWLRETERWVFEKRDGEPILVSYSLDDPLCPPKPSKPETIPFEPYLKARLAVAVLRLNEQENLPIDRALAQVAKQFRLYIDGEAHGPREVDGSQIVARAYKACLEYQTGWAGIPLRVATRELGRVYKPWPPEERTGELLAYAAKEAENPARVSSTSGDFWSNCPEQAAVESVGEKFGLPYDITIELCRMRIEPTSPLPHFKLEDWLMAK